MADAVARRIDEHRASEPGRGREADAPTEIPHLGWKDILYRLWDEIFKDRIGTIAAGTTFYIILSIFPALGALVSLYGLIADPGTIQSHLADLRGLVPAAMLELLDQELTRLMGSREESLGWSFGLGLAVALWSANSGMKALFDALNVAYDEEEKRGFIQLNLQSLGFTLGAILFFILLLNVVIGVPVILNLLPLGPLASVLVSVLPALLLFAVAALVIAVLYRYGPSRANAQWRWITPGSLGAAFVWLLGSVLFSWYLANWGNYSATYGSLGAAIGMMMWIYISLWIVLVGAELNSEIEHQTARDTTTGPAKPLGTRGAAMADRVGEARA
jgi:membrane protein